MDGDDRPVVGFAMLAHAMFHTYELSIPVFVAVWLDSFGVSAAVLGTAVGVGYGFVGLGALPSGILADRYGSKILVVGSIAGMGTGFLLLSIAPTVWVLALALAFWGLAASLYHPAGLSLLSRGTQERSNAFALHGAAGNVGTVLGPLAAALALTFLQWRFVTALFAIPALIAVSVSLRVDIEAAVGDSGSEPLETESEGKTDTNAGDDVAATDGGISTVGDFLSSSRALFTGGFVMIFALIMSYGLYYRGVFTFLPNVLGGLPYFDPVSVLGRTFQPSQYVYSGLLLIGVFGQYAGGRLSESVRIERALVGTFLALALASLAFVPASEVGIIPLLAVCVALGFLIYVAVPIYQAGVAEYATEEVHGLSYGFTYLGMFGVGALGASVAGVALTYADATALFATLAGFALVCALLGTYLLYSTRRPAGAASDADARP
ncbi:MFS transporter [Halobacteriales archaeon QS_3_64_16]|nr:MAG: MFS transporter [Halobacteriales archaeon QS_3_64_16]